MITLVTGVPGAGKTLWVVNQIRTKLLEQNRPIFSNINGLNFDSPLVQLVEDDLMQKWMGSPEGSIFIFDECQAAYRPRASGAKVPDYIAAFETHRHHGYDFYLITQHPGFLDKNVRELVGRHVHLYRPFGLKRSQVFEWPSFNPEPNPSQDRTNAAKSQFIFKKQDFDHYKSSVQHTHKLNLPKNLILVLLASFTALGVGSYLAGKKLGFYGRPVASADASPATQSLEGFPTVDVKDRREGNPQETVGQSCRYRGRIGDTLLVTHSQKGNIAVPRLSVLDTCTQLY